MNVQELITLLEQMDPNAEVHIGYDYGDYSHTTVAPTAANVRCTQVKWSDYHQMDAECDECDDTGREVVVIV